ncbi:MAG TPA: acyltransferase [Chryseosolibacter sp.]|nr:acyltransferase [Chryseosolibacter sp.]
MASDTPTINFDHDFRATTAQQLRENYLIQLDTLRTLAVAMVVFSHWAGYHKNMWSDDLFWLNGEIGVKMFFIISGFLITGILLKERQTCEQFRSGKVGVLKQFYIRRFLRMFPVYYATIFLTLLLFNTRQV